MMMSLETWILVLVQLMPKPRTKHFRSCMISSIQDADFKHLRRWMNHVIIAFCITLCLYGE